MSERPSTILVTGTAGFIGFHVAMRLLDRGDHVIGLDNINDYYDVRLKEARLAELKPRGRQSSSHKRSIWHPATSTRGTPARPSWSSLFAGQSTCLHREQY